MNKRRLAAGIVGGLVGLGAVVGGVRKVSDRNSGSNLPVVSGEVIYSVDKGKELFGCSSKEGIKNVFLFDGNRSFCLNPSETNSYPIAGDKIDRWIGDVTEVPAGRYDLMVVTRSDKVVNAGSYEVGNKK